MRATPQACDCAGIPWCGAAAPPRQRQGVGEQCPQGTILAEAEKAKHGDCGTAARDCLPTDVGAPMANHGDCGRIERVPNQTVPPDLAPGSQLGLCGSAWCPPPLVSTAAPIMVAPEGSGATARRPLHTGGAGSGARVPTRWLHQARCSPPLR